MLLFTISFSNFSIVDSPKKIKALWKSLISCCISVDFDEDGAVLLSGYVQYLFFTDWTSTDHFFIEQLSPELKLRTAGIRRIYSIRRIFAIWLFIFVFAQPSPLCNVHFHHQCVIGILRFICRENNMLKVTVYTKI